ncbi:hypothetical protein RN22_10915 [Grimontia sp. AD028]|uniref:hypothetical protein n=1 Tax=Grimontia sp. AD028 TaxID=1581149 RepID=UPI00061ADD7F|nr:hypothetical protein [Grimontia sp. AD028]KKD60438.1 hypothetical protein RN22_10915 [Grimontia sp. AD028]
MNTVIPLLILFIVTALIVNYCYAVYYRRKVILPLVIDFLRDESVSSGAKFMASHAFEDSLDVFLILKVAKAAKSRSEDNKTKSIGFLSNLDDDAKRRLFEIFDRSIKLNLQVAFPVYAWAGVKYNSFTVNTSSKHKELKRKVKTELISYTDQEFKQNYA